MGSRRGAGSFRTGRVISGSSGPRQYFATTQWSLVLTAGDVASGQQEVAREQLCRRYWPALYAWLRREGYPAADAEDLVQGFLARFLARNDFAQASSERGRFRSYLLSGLRNHVVSEGRRERAAKRGGSEQVVSLEELQAEEIAGAATPPDLSAQQAFDRRWLAAVLQEALRQLEADYAAAGQIERYRALLPWLTADPPDGSYDGLAARLGVARPTIATWVSRLRLRYREAVHAQVRETTSSAEEFQRELAELLSLIG